MPPLALPPSLQTAPQQLRQPPLAAPVTLKALPLAGGDTKAVSTSSSSMSPEMAMAAEGQRHRQIRAQWWQKHLRLQHRRNQHSAQQAEAAAAATASSKANGGTTGVLVVQQPVMGSSPLAVFEHVMQERKMNLLSVLSMRRL